MNTTSLPPQPTLRREMMEGSERSGFRDGSKSWMVLGSPEQYDYWNWIARSVGIAEVGPEREEKRKDILVLRRRVLGY